MYTVILFVELYVLAFPFLIQYNLNIGMHIYIFNLNLSLSVSKTESRNSGTEQETVYYSLGTTYI